MIAAGGLTDRIQFRRAVLADDGFAQIETWADHGAPVWAKRMDVQDAERWRAGAVGAHLTTRFQVRWSAFAAAITPKDRLVCEGREYDISGIKVVERRALLEITAAARVDG